MLPPRKPSYRIRPEDVPEIKRRIQKGEYLNRIAADYDVNPGRIAEIKTGEKFAEIPAAR
jgi:anti-sigma28 factor (negative regulator of flagellin synthesis)